MPRAKKEQPNRADGLYEIKITIGKDMDGKLIRKSFYSSISREDARRQANEWKIEQEVATRTGLSSVSENKNFGHLARQWLRAKQGTVKPYTYQNTYCVKVEKYILPYFEKADVSMIKNADIQNFLNGLSYLSIDMLDTLRMILRSIFDFGIENDVCFKNPAKKINIRSNYIPKGRHVYTLEQSNLLYRYAIETAQIDLAILLKTGIRRSELLALKWSNVDFDHRCLWVLGAVTPSVTGAEDGTTKSESGMRAIPLDAELLEILRCIADTGYIIQGNGNHFLSPTTYAKNFRIQMKEAAENLSIPELTPHELRHTFGTLLRQGGADIYTIQKVLGHADISITAKIYVHNDLEVLRKNMKGIL